MKGRVVILDGKTKQIGLCLEDSSFRVFFTFPVSLGEGMGQNIAFNTPLLRKSTPAVKMGQFK